MDRDKLMMLVEKFSPSLNKSKWNVNSIFRYLANKVSLICFQAIMQIEKED